MLEFELTLTYTATVTVAKTMFFNNAHWTLHHCGILGMITR